MKHQVTFETAIFVTKYALSPIKCWPPPIGSSESFILRHNLCLCASAVNLLIIVAAYLYNIYEKRDDPIRIIKITSEMCTLLSTLAKMMICKIEAPRLQTLIAELVTFLKHATREEKELIQYYVDKCLLPHAIVFISGIIAPLAFVLSPMLTAQLLPGDTAFPFSIESYWVWISLYISQSICAVQVGCMIYVDVLFAILLWYAGARFQMLSMDFRTATNIDELHRCARKHQKLLRYTDELRIILRIVAVEVTITAGIAIVAGGFVLIQNPTPYEAGKYVFYEMASAVELFLYSWPADNLIETSEKVGDAAYNCNWIGKSPQMLKDLLIVIQRSRNPIIISVKGILPVLSLEFYGSTMAATFSYLTALRAMTDDVK